MLNELKKEVYEANMLLLKHKLVTFTWGNVSGIDRDNGIMIIKPSGIEYDKLNIDTMVMVDLVSGNVIDNTLNPSTDTDTHLHLYRTFSNINGIAHTHSRWATTMAQAGLSIVPYGTTHGDYFYGEIPCTREMTVEEIIGNYELETGRVITETFNGKSPDDIPAVLVRSHGPFTWGTSPQNAVYNAVVLENISFMAWHDILINKNINQIQSELLNKHYLRKHGANLYYGQK